MSFHTLGLDPQLLKNVADQGYTLTTPIQKKAIPAILEGRDVVGLAQTGTGKTAAFVLPLLHRLLHGPRRQLRVLVVGPTRELAEQTKDVFTKLGQGTGFRCVTIYGGVGSGRRSTASARARKSPSPAPAVCWISSARANSNLNHVECLVLDEADRMFDMGFLPDIRKILQTPAGQAPDPALLRDHARRNPQAGPRNPAPSRHRPDCAFQAGRDGRPRAVSGGAKPQVAVAAGGHEENRRRLGAGLHAHEAPRQAPRRPARRSRATVPRACRAICPSASGRPRWTASSPAPTRSWWRPISPPAASTWKTSRTSSTSTCRPPWTTTRTASAAPAARRRPATPSPSSPAKTTPPYAPSNA